MSQIVFDLQAHLRDMESRITAAIDANAITADKAHQSLANTQEDISVLIRDHERRLAAAELDITQGKWIGRTAIVAAGGLLLDFFRTKVFGGGG